MSVTSLHHLVQEAKTAQRQNREFGQPLYGYRPSSPSVYPTYASSYEPSSPTIGCRFNARPRFTGRKTISETLATLVPALLEQSKPHAVDDSALPIAALYDQQSGEIQPAVFEEVVKCCFGKK